MAEITYTGWLQGYMSGINNSQGARNLKTIEIPEYKTLALMVESYCLKTPRSIVALEAFRIFNDLAEK